METRQLDAPPRLGGLYRAAVLSTLRRRGGSSTAGVPEVELVLPGVTIDRAHLAAYDRVCGFRLGDRLPATYPHVLAFPLAMALLGRPDFPLPLVGLVHLANRSERYRPVTADETLELRVRAGNLRPHERGRQVDVLAVASVAGETVWRGRSTYLHRETPSGAHRAASEPPAPTAVWPVERRVGPDYAAVSGDRNPIHTSRLGARLFGFPRPIAHGMWSKARCLAALEGRLPDTCTVDVAFKAPILLPGRIGFAAHRTAQGWEFSLAGRRPHLAGEVTGP